MATETSTTSKESNKKVPKRIHKSQREKKKREHLNELFLDLANALDISEHNTCKVSILIEAARVVKDTLAEMKCLKELNTTLLAESDYVAVETNELKDDNLALEAEIGKLRSEIKSRVSEMQLDLNEIPPENQNQEGTSHTPESLVMFPQQSGKFVNSLHFPTFCTTVESSYPGFGTQIINPLHSVVSKPHARYPTSGDTWPSQILEELPEPGKDTQDEYRKEDRSAEVRL